MEVHQEVEHQVEGHFHTLAEVAGPDCNLPLHHQGEACNQLAAHRRVLHHNLVTAAGPEGK